MTHHTLTPDKPNAENLIQALNEARTLEDVRACHATFLDAVLRQCCCGGSKGRGGTWRHIGRSLAQIMDAALLFCDLHGQLLELRWRVQEEATHSCTAAILQVGLGSRQSCFTGICMGSCWRSGGACGARP